MNTSETSIHISIEYKKRGESHWLTQRLRPDEYFEPDEDGAAFELSSVPRHNHGIDYLDVTPLEVSVVRTTIRSLGSGAHRVITEAFWNDGLCRVIECIDAGEQPFSELIVESTIGKQAGVWAIQRFVRQDGVWMPIFHSLIYDEKDGTEREERVL